MSKDPEEELRSLDGALNKLLDLFDSFPAPVKARARKDIEMMSAMLRERRHPRVMLLGRRGAGKSLLTNALLGAPVRSTSAVVAGTGAAEWEMLKFADREIEILDTRGVQESSKPTEDDPDETAEGSLLTAVRAKCPDVILYLVKAKDADTAITGDLASLAQVHREALAVHGTEIQIVPVVTQCDELHPSDVRFPPHGKENEEKYQHVRKASSVVSRHLGNHPYLAQYVAGAPVPISALVYFDERERIIPERDYRWNMESLALRMQEVLPDSTQIAFVRLAQFRRVQVKVARKLVMVAAGICLAIGMEPIPLADLPFIVSVQTAMIMAIAYISGRAVSIETCQELVAVLGANIGVGVTLREISRALLKFLPGPGNAISGAIAAAGTKAIGEAAILYFIDQQPRSAVRRTLARGV